MKKCPKCKVEKDVNGFYKDAKTKDGLNGICKVCRLEMDRNRRKSNPEWVQRRKENNSLYHQKNRDVVRARHRKIRGTEEGKLSHQRSVAKWKKQNSNKVLAHRAIERAVLRGEIIPKKNCEVCGSNYNIEAHHPDYRKRLEVIWLCKMCHSKLS